MNNKLAIVIALTIVLLIVIFAHKNAAPVEKTLYERLGGVYSIAAVIDRFSDALVDNPVVGKNSQNEFLRDWHRNQLIRLPGLKFMRTLWVCALSGGPFKYSPTVPGKNIMGLENAHAKLVISPEEFDAVAVELANTLDHFAVPAREKGEVLGAFAAHKNEVTKSYFDCKAGKSLTKASICPFSSLLQ